MPMLKEKQRTLLAASVLLLLTLLLATVHHRHHTPAIVYYSSQSAADGTEQRSRESDQTAAAAAMAEKQLNQPEQTRQEAIINADTETRPDQPEQTRQEAIINADTETRPDQPEQTRQESRINAEPEKRPDQPQQTRQEAIINAEPEKRPDQPQQIRQEAIINAEPEKQPDQPEQTREEPRISADTETGPDPPQHTQQEPRMDTDTAKRPDQPHQAREELRINADAGQRNSSSASTPQTEAGLRRICRRLSPAESGLETDLLAVMEWVCRKLGINPPQQGHTRRCNKTVMYVAEGRLGSLLSLYATLYGLTRKYGISAYVTPFMWDRLIDNFPHISLSKPPSEPPHIDWEMITYADVGKSLPCSRAGTSSEPTYYLITDYPDRNGIDVFHPFAADLREELRLSDRLQREAQNFLRHVSANCSSVTFVGLHVRRTDYLLHVQGDERSLPGAAYFGAALRYYRSRHADALFVVCSDDMEYVQLALRQAEFRRPDGADDLVFAGDRQLNQPGRDLALLVACNHSIITVGSFGFWAAYLAGGTVLVPERQGHFLKGDRNAPKLEIQLAGANNWIAIP